MIQYIDKSAVVAKIEDIIAEEKESIKCFERSKNLCELLRFNAKIDLLEYILSFLNTLEVKEVEVEVDLEKEIDEKYRKDTSTLKIRNKYAELAKYFFELGLKAQKGE